MDWKQKSLCLPEKPPELRVQVLTLYAQERYADFGPTLMAEHLAKEGLVVDHETLRRWRMAEGQHTVRRRKQVHRQWRERKPSFGAKARGRVVQLAVRDSGRPPLRSGLPASRTASRGNRTMNNNQRRGHSLVSYTGDI